MPVADDAVKPSPPWLVVAVLVFVRFVLTPMLALVRVVARTITYPGLAAVWVLSAASAAKVVVGRAWGESSAPFVFLQALRDEALKVSLYTAFLLLALAAVLLCEMCLVYATAVVSGSGSEFKKESTREFCPRTAVLGTVASVPFFFLLFAGALTKIMMSSPMEGSKGEMIGSVIMDLGVFGTNAIYCFVVIPALALDTWRSDQSNRKAGLTLAVR